MSGGFFDYMQHNISEVADRIQYEIDNNSNRPDWVSDEDWDGQKYSDETITKFKEAVKVLRIAEVYTQRIDWLLSGDDGEDSFHRRLKDDLSNLALKDKAMREVEEKIALAKQKGTWDGVDVDEFMKQFR